MPVRGHSCPRAGQPTAPTRLGCVGCVGVSDLDGGSHAGELTAEHSRGWGCEDTGDGGTRGTGRRGQCLQSGVSAGPLGGRRGAQAPHDLVHRVDEAV